MVFENVLKRPSAVTCARRLKCCTDANTVGCRNLVTRRTISAVAIVIIVAAAIVTAYWVTRPSPPPKEMVGVYGYTTSDVVMSWDPSDAFSNEIVVMQNIYEPLVRYDSKADKFIPVLATSWESSADGLVWTFHLRQGVKFHTGNEFDANAVRYSINRTITRGQGAAWIWSSVQEVKVVDKYTVQFILQYAAPLTSVAASSYAAYILDPKAIEEGGADFFAQANEVGTGPYMLERYSKAEDMVVLKKFPDYWGGWEGKHFDKVIIKAVPESATARQLLEAGEVDILDDLPYEDVAALKTKPGIEIVTTGSFQNLLAFFNTQRPPLDNKLVRTAVSYSFPYEQVLRDVMSGYATQARGPIPKGMWAYSEEVPQYTYDLQKAKQLLTEAGYPTGGLSLTLTYNSGDENERKTAELWKSEAAKIGIDLAIRGMTWEQQWDMAKSPTPEARQDIFMMYWWPDIAGDPYSFVYNMFHSEKEPVFAMSYYNNTRFDGLIDEAFTISGVDRARAKQMYVEAEKILVEDAVAVFIYDQQYVRIKRTSLMGYVDNPTYPHVVFFYYTYRQE